MASCDDTSKYYPVANLVDEDASTYTRTRNDTGTKTWMFDLGSGNTATYDCFALANHNFSTNGTFQVGRSTASFAACAIQTATMTDTHFIHYFHNQGTHRYLKFTSAETMSEDYHKIGEVWVGERVTFTRNPQIPIKIINDKEEVVHTTRGGQRWSYWMNETKGYEMRFINNVSPTQYASMEKVFNNRQHSKPFFLDLYPQDSNNKVLFVHNEDFDFSIDGKDMRPGTWTVREEK